MSKPLVAIFSGDSAYISELHRRLKAVFRLAVCESLAEAGELLERERPWGFVADCVECSVGAQRETRLLDRLQQLAPGTFVVLVTSGDGPGALQSRARDEEVVHLPGGRDGSVTAGVLMGALSAPLPSPGGNGSGSGGRPSGNGRTSPGTGAHRNGSDGPGLRDGGRIVRRFETHSPAFRRTLTELEIAARHEVSVLLIGETGAGKSYLARLIHEASPRRKAPFLTVPCGALPSELIESELFGHVKGAFTGAHADKEGKFVAAGGGTVFLDEIDVLDPEQQVKLLRVIETGEFEPVGSNRTLTSRARVIAASNVTLEPLVEERRFRADLYYRLTMLQFEIPPLRERAADVIPLARRFIERFSGKHATPVRRIAPGFFEALSGYPWPGNVRELEHAVQRAVIYSEDGVLAERHLPASVLEGRRAAVRRRVDSAETRPRSSTLGDQIALTERGIIEQTLRRNNFCRTTTARELGISRVTLYNKMKKYGMSASRS